MKTIPNIIKISAAIFAIVNFSLNMILDNTEIMITFEKNNAIASDGFINLILMLKNNNPKVPLFFYRIIINFVLVK